MRWPPPFPATRKLEGFRLTATDTSWNIGDGPDVQAPVSTLLLLCTGRPTALTHLSGKGAHALTTRFLQASS